MIAPIVVVGCLPAPTQRKTLEKCGIGESNHGHRQTRNNDCKSNNDNARRCNLLGNSGWGNNFNVCDDKIKQESGEL